MPVNRLMIGCDKHSFLALVIVKIAPENFRPKFSWEI